MIIKSAKTRYQHQEESLYHSGLAKLLEKQENSQQYVNSAFNRHYNTHPETQTHYGTSGLKGVGYGALTGGLLSAGMGALGSKKGYRLKGALEGLVAGGIGGAAAGGLTGLAVEASRVSSEDAKKQKLTEAHLLANDPKYSKHQKILDKVDSEIYDHKWKFGKIQEEEEREALERRLEELENNHQDLTGRYYDLLDRYDDYNPSNRYW